MNCESAQLNILREQTGELTGLELRKTRQHLAECEDCRRFREETLRMMELGATPEPGRRARPDTLERIMQAARAETARTAVPTFQPAPAPTFFHRFPVLRYAAAIVALAAAAGLFFRLYIPATRTTDLARVETVAPIAPAPPTEIPMPLPPEKMPLDIAWDSPIGDELFELDQALAVAAAEDIFAETGPDALTDQDPDELIRELMELEGVQI